MKNIFLFFMIVLFFCSFASASSNLLSENFTASDSTAINGFNGWLCGLPSPSTATIVSNAGKLDRPSAGGDAYCDHNISTAVTTSYNLNVTFQMDKDSGYNALFGICTTGEANTSSSCTWNSANGYGKQGYLLVFDASSVTLNLQDFNNNYAIFNVGLTYTPYASYTVYIFSNASNQYINFYQNGTLLRSVMNNTLTSFKAVGIANWNHATRFDNIIVTYYDAPATPDMTTQFVSPTPTDNYHNNVQSVLNISTGSTANITLYFDQSNPPTTKVVQSQNVNYVAWTMNATSQGTYYYKAVANFSGTANSTSVYSWVYDISSPTITLNGNNFFGVSNNTNLYRTQSNKNLSVNFTDNIGLYGYEINITNSTGYTKFYVLDTSLSGTLKTKINTVDFSAWAFQNYTVYIGVADTHTASRIPDYQVDYAQQQSTRNCMVRGEDVICDMIPVPNDINIVTENGYDLNMRSSAGSITLNKEDDRYSFDFDTSGADSEFTVNLGTSYSFQGVNDDYPGHVILGDGNSLNGNWIDFACDTPFDDFLIDDYQNIIVTWRDNGEGIPQNIHCESIGGLNNYNITYKFGFLTPMPAFVPPTPDDGAGSMTQVTINVSCTDGNISMWFDSNANPSNKVLSSASLIASWTTNVTTANTYYYKASCDNGISFSSVRSWGYSTLYISNFTPSNSTPYYQENQTVKFNVTAVGVGTINYAWFKNSILQAITNAYSWVIGLFEADSGNPVNVTVFINDSTGAKVSQTWMVNVNNLYYNSFSASPLNVSWSYENIYLSCSVNQSTGGSVVTLYYRASGSSLWNVINSTVHTSLDFYNATLTTSPSYSGYLDIMCNATNTSTGVTVIQELDDYVNIYETAIPPTVPISFNTKSGKYDSTVHLSCGDSFSYGGDNIYYDIQVRYVKNNTLHLWEMADANSSGEYDWYILNLPVQDNATYRCRAYDGSYSAWAESRVNISIHHTLSLNLLESNIYRRYFPGQNIILTDYCSVENMENSKISATFADCNDDGQWDYYFDYDKMRNNTGKTYPRVADMFTCVYTSSGVKSLTIGCMTQRIDSLKPWDTDFCKDDSTSSDYCIFQKKYGITVYEEFR